MSYKELYATNYTEGEFATIVPGRVLRQAKPRVRGNVFTILCYLELKLGILFHYLSRSLPIFVHKASLVPIALAHTKKKTQHINNQAAQHRPEKQHACRCDKSNPSSLFLPRCLIIQGIHHKHGLIFHLLVP